MNIQKVNPEAFAFYSASISSLLETAVDAYVENLSILCGGDADFGRWLDGTWRADEQRHGDCMKTYVADRWPQFLWDDAYREYVRSIPRNTTQHLNSSKAMEMLSRCVTETEATMMYRCIHSSARDEQLRQLTAELSRDEVRHYKMFKRMFSKYLKEERIGLIRAIRTIFSRTDMTLSRDVALAFRSLNTNWRRPSPFGRVDYKTFLTVAGQVIKMHLPTAAAERMLLKPLEQFATYSRGWRLFMRHALLYRLHRNLGKLKIQAA